MAVTITKPKLVVTEGGDDEAVVSSIAAQIGNLELIQFHPLGGNTAWGPALKALKNTDGFDGVDAMLLVRDADTNPNQTFQSVQGALQSAGLPVPTQPGQWRDGEPRTAIFVSPADGQPGEIEDLCLATVSADPLMTCVDGAIACATQLGWSSHKVAKARLQIFIALQDDVCKTLPVAVSKGVFPVHSPAYDPIRGLLQQF